MLQGIDASGYYERSDDNIAHMAKHLLKTTFVKEGSLDSVQHSADALAYTSPKTSSKICNHTVDCPVAHALDLLIAQATGGAYSFSETPLLLPRSWPTMVMVEADL